MTTVYLIRHAQAEGNLYRRCHGWYNGLITEKGYRQIDALAVRFQDVHIDAVYSSDLFRTMTTARAILHTRNLSLRVDPQLREIGGGCWEDHTWGELLRRDQERMLAFLRCDPAWHVTGSETYPELQQRIHTAVERIAASHPDQTVAVFAHGSAIRSGLAFWLGLPLERMGELPLGDNTSVAKLEFEGGSCKVCYYNDASHLGDLAGSPRRGDGSGDTKAKDLAAISLYFIPLRLPEQKDRYLSARQEGWLTSHGTMDNFDGPAFLATAQRNHDFDPASVLLAMAGDSPVGILQMDFQQEAERKIGRVPFFYIMPEYRSQGLGVQMLGQAISAFRNRGRQYIRLRCAPENNRAKQFYQSHSFYKVGEESGGIGHLDTMERYIGYVLG
ncbi:MAG TPA: GNAT family N-acetyltransferase [Candidatus Enterenecus stercoripullorum]|nr:GNAT family N-acetyltransferase [Candidatus Enterenecus stercoripullorum]